MIGIFGILAVGPHMANQVPSVVGFVINSVCIFVMLVLGCHNVIYFNHATFVLTYLLLYGNDVNGVVYGKRVLRLYAWAAFGLPCVCTEIIGRRNVRDV